MSDKLKAIANPTKTHNVGSIYYGINTGTERKGCSSSGSEATVQWLRSVYIREKHAMEKF